MKKTPPVKCLRNCFSDQIENLTEKLTIVIKHCLSDAFPFKKVSMFFNFLCIAKYIPIFIMFYIQTLLSG